MNRSVINSTRFTPLVSDLEIAETAWRRIKGLIGCSYSSFRKGKGLRLFPCEGVHTIGMKFPIDVAYLDKDLRVVHVYNCLRPCRVGRISWKSRSVLELPAGVLADSRTEVGDTLQFILTGN